MDTSSSVAWSAGDYSQVARMLAPLAARVVEAVAPTGGNVVVDVACGSGNAALAAAKHGARVVGVDFTEQMLRLACEREHNVGHAGVLWVLGDARALPIRTASADVVLSTFGLIFAPDPATVATELARVARPGARLGLGVWSPDQPVATPLGDAVDELLPGPPVTTPGGDEYRYTAWGEQQFVEAWLSEFEHLTLSRQSMQWVHESAETVVDFLTQGSSVHASRFTALPGAQQLRVRDGLLEAAEASLDDDGRLREDANWTLITAIRSA
jgi:ubiquinone/menaquinone biosynthesis C-methylase UbiE